MRAGDSVMVTVPAQVARKWKKAGAVAILWELDGEVLRATPQTIVEHHYHLVRVPLEEEPDANSGH